MDRILKGVAFLKNAGSTVAAKVGAAFFGVVGVSASAVAAVPTEATDALTDLQTDGLALISAGWPVLAAIVGGLILMSIFKRVAGKAAG